MVVYVVSGAPDIKAAYDLLNDSGRKLVYDTEVDERPTATLDPAQSYIVVAHGRPDRVLLYRSDWNESRSWIRVGMASPPRNARIYLYACWAGTELVDFLEDCEAFGHIDTVPIPDHDCCHIVFEYLEQVEQLIEQPYDRPEWFVTLGDYVDNRHAQVCLDGGPDAFLDSVIWTLLRRSLGRANTTSTEPRGASGCGAAPMNHTQNSGELGSDS